MLSFQPEADTGRTIFSQERALPERVWEKICEGTGLPLEKVEPISVILIATAGLQFSSHAAPANTCRSCRPTRSSKRLLGEVLATIGGLSLVNDDARDPAWRLAGILAQNPGSGAALGIPHGALHHFRTHFASGMLQRSRQPDKRTRSGSARTISWTQSKSRRPIPIR